MNAAFQPFLTFIACTWADGLRFAEMRSTLSGMHADFTPRFDEIVACLDRIERKLDHYGARSVRVAQRTSLMHR